MPGKMIYAQYTDNNADTYSVKIRKYLFDLKEDAGQGGNDALSLLKFGAFDAADPILPRGKVMRRVRVQDASGGITRYVPSGTTASRLWAGTQTTLELDYSGVSGTETFNRVGLTAEKEGQVAHTIVNMSDAA
jgi:hypothetical protein